MKQTDIEMVFELGTGNRDLGTVCLAGAIDARVND